VRERTHTKIAMGERKHTGEKENANKSYGKKKERASCYKKRRKKKKKERKYGVHDYIYTCTFYMYIL